MAKSYLEQNLGDYNLAVKQFKKEFNAEIKQKVEAIRKGRKQKYKVDEDGKISYKKKKCIIF